VYGQRISTLEFNTMCERQLIVATASVLGVLAVAVLILGALYYSYERELKLYLFAKGWCIRWVQEEEMDRDKKFDAFVSYCNTDERFVFDNIVRVLENEKYGFRLCVHSRDWVVGEWIPAQIAQSVEQSRRTLIVLSRSFLKSVWGRLEFRTAHISAVKDGRARVVIVLLENREDLEDELDVELKSYLATNTYVKWGDPQFYEKLRYALPSRREEKNKCHAGVTAEIALKCPISYEQIHL
jgi:protein toll